MLDKSRIRCNFICFCSHNFRKKYNNRESGTRISFASWTKENPAEALASFRFSLSRCYLSTCGCTNKHVSHSSEHRRRPSNSSSTKWSVRTHTPTRRKTRVIIVTSRRRDNGRANSRSWAVDRLPGSESRADCELPDGGGGWNVLVNCWGLRDFLLCWHERGWIPPKVSVARIAGERRRPVVQLFVS